MTHKRSFKISFTVFFAAMSHYSPTNIPLHVLQRLLIKWSTNRESVTNRQIIIGSNTFSFCQFLSKVTHNGNKYSVRNNYPDYSEVDKWKWKNVIVSELTEIRVSNKVQTFFRRLFKITPKFPAKSFVHHFRIPIRHSIHSSPNLTSTVHPVYFAASQYCFHHLPIGRLREF